MIYFVGTTGVGGDGATACRDCENEGGKAGWVEGVDSETRADSAALEAVVVLKRRKQKIRHLFSQCKSINELSH